MGSINGSLASAASALDAFQYALSVTQNNIGNASTPGYAEQSVDFQAAPFDPSTGLAGGVQNGPLIDSRDMLAESEVWQNASANGDSTAQSQALTAVQNALPTTAGTGIAAALTNFFNEASAWSASPNDSSAQEAVMDSAQSLAASFQTTSAAVSSASQSVSTDIDGTVSQINRLTTQLASLNQETQNGGGPDAGVQAQIYSTLQTLSGLVNINVLPQQDGAVEVTLSSGAALVMGANQYSLSAVNSTPSAQSADPQAPPDIVIQAADGSDVTAQVTSGTLHGLLVVRNTTIPGLIGDSTQPGSLNLLASTLANSVNQIVSQGSVSAGVPAPSGLFVYDQNSASAAAATLAVDPNMTAAQLPPIDRNGVPNGVPLALSNLANPQNAADEIDSTSYVTYYGNLTAQVGSQLDQAQSNQTLSSQTLAQAESMRQTASGVSLDAEATDVLEFQDGYQAVAKLVSTLDTLVQAVIDMIPNAS